MSMCWHKSLLIMASVGPLLYLHKTHLKLSLKHESTLCLQWPLPLKEWAGKVAKSAVFHGVQSKRQRLPSQLSVCGATCPLCFQFGKHAYFHLDPNALVNVNQVGLSSRSMQTWERIHSVHPRDSSMTGVYYTREWAGVWGELLWIANVKLLTCLLCKLHDVL